MISRKVSQYETHVYSLSYRDLEEMMAERGLSVDHVTIWRWVQRYAPVLNQRIRRELRRPNRSWRVDETYVKVAGNWAYLYRAVDSAGETIEFMLSPKRDLVVSKISNCIRWIAPGFDIPRGSDRRAPMPDKAVILICAATGHARFDTH